jgi:hypothetical protein
MGCALVACGGGASSVASPPAVAGAAPDTEAVATVTQAASVSDARPNARVADDEGARARASSDEATPSTTASPGAAGAPGAPANLDPLSIDGELEAATIPKVVKTPNGELRKKSRSDLDAALAVAKRQESVDSAIAAIVRRVGKPSWVEADGLRHVWVAPERGKCHRLVLDSDGSLELETADDSEWKLLSAMARQKLCSGDIERGMPGK